MKCLHTNNSALPTLLYYSHAMLFSFKHVHGEHLAVREKILSQFTPNSRVLSNSWDSTSPVVSPAAISPAAVTRTPIHPHTAEKLRKNMQVGYCFFV